MEPNVILTRHARKRLKERCGLGKSSLSKTAEKALEMGMSHEDATGRLKKYLDWLWFEHKTSNNTRIWGEMVYLFCGNKLITVIPLPKEHRSAVKKFFNKQEE